MKQKEKDFAKKLLKITKGKPYISGKAIDLMNDDKQLYYYLEKWTNKGWWEWGVTSRSGWFTPEGIEHFKNANL